MKITIVGYRNVDDIDVQFEDGTIIEHKRYQAFCKGFIPYFTNKEDKFANKRIGKTVISKNGMKMTIIAYRNSKDIDIKFENGAIAKHRSYSNFIKGSISYPVNLAKTRIGETSITKNNLKMTIIAYRKNNDIDIQFEDGTIVKHKSYACFLEGSIEYPEYLIKNRIGEISTAKNGMKMTIIAYRKNNDIDIQFEDGTIVRHKCYYNFLSGSILYGANPVDKFANKRIGKTSMASNGLKMTIIAYRGVYDIDIKFEDGIIVEHISYSSFVKSRNIHPELARGGSHLYHGYTIQKVSTLPGNIALYSCTDQDDNTSIMTLQELLDKAGVKRLDFSEKSENTDNITENTAS